MAKAVAKPKPSKGVRKPPLQQRRVATSQPVPKPQALSNSRSAQLGTRSSERPKKLPLKLLASLHVPTPAPAVPAAASVPPTRVPAISKPNLNAGNGKRKRQLSVKLEDSILELGRRVESRRLQGQAAKRAKTAAASSKAGVARWLPSRRRLDSSRQHTPIVLRLKPALLPTQEHVKMEPAGTVIKQEFEQVSAAATMS